MINATAASAAPAASVPARGALPAPPVLRAPPPAPPAGLGYATAVSAMTRSTLCVYVCACVCVSQLYDLEAVEATDLALKTGDRIKLLVTRGRACMLINKGAFVTGCELIVVEGRNQWTRWQFSIELRAARNVLRHCLSGCLNLEHDKTHDVHPTQSAKIMIETVLEQLFSDLTQLCATLLTESDGLTDTQVGGDWQQTQSKPCWVVFADETHNARGVSANDVVSYRGE
jgi:hypothetical protein